MCKGTKFENSKLRNRPQKNKAQIRWLFSFLGAELSAFFITSCPAVRSIHAQKRGILASIGARLERFVFIKQIAEATFL
jgi:hypothetical protein